MCPHQRTGKGVPVINILHHCRLSGTYRFPNPEIMFKNALSILRNNKDAVEWLTDKGKNEVDGMPAYRRFRDYIEEGLRNVAASGSRLFRKDSMQTKEQWQAVDKWRKHKAVLFLLRYNKSVCPHVCKHVSL